ncbi:MAG: hypothetical protein ACHQ52_03225 [Candidatus Eisenbacteria bacterium]
MPATPSRIDPLWVGTALLAITRVAMALLVPVAAEDAFITFRFARSLAQGRGAVFNPGEHVMGFTSLPWMLWIAAGLPLARDPMLWTRVSAGALSWVTLACTCRLLERHASRSAAWVFVVVFSAWPFFASLPASGMEMDLLLAAMALSMWLIDRGSAFAGPALGLLALTRPESLVAAAVLAVVARPRDRLFALGMVVVAVAGLTWYFGSPLPNSMLAKAGVYGTPGPWAERAWWDWLFPIDLGRAPLASEPVQLWAIRIVLAPAALAGLWSLRRQRLLALPLAGLAIWAGYALLGVAYFFWYFAVPAYTAVMLAAVGLPRVSRGAWIPIAGALFIIGTWTIFPVGIYRARALAETRLFGQMAMTLRGQSQPDDLLLAEPIGFIGWYDPGLRIMDETGLVSPEVWKRRRQGPGWYADLVSQRRPRWLLIRSGFLDRGDSFAGTGAPFRDAEEARRIFAEYRLTATTGQHPDRPEMELYRLEP